MPVVRVNLWFDWGQAVGRSAVRRKNPFVVASVLAALLAALAGCAMLPSAVPRTSAMLAGPETPQNFALVEIEPDMLAVLNQKGPPSFSGAFPAYHPPRTQVIGIGDSVQITIWEAGAGGLFSAPAFDRMSPGSRSATIPDQVVAGDGAVTVPYAGRIPVTGHTPPDVEKVIVNRLAELAIKPQALVTVTRNVSNTATIMGEVGPGARVSLSVRGDRLLEVIAAAGGIHAPVEDISIGLTRDDHTVRVPMQVLLQEPRENVFVQPGDVITLTREPQSFLTAGALPRIGQIPFGALGISLAEALIRAGGLQTERSDPQGVFLLREEPASLVRAYPKAQLGPETVDTVRVIYRLDMREPLVMHVSPA
jgi:polysaccharide export outer membrane protein